MLVLVDLDHAAPDAEGTRTLDNMIGLNAQALLGLNVTVYWRPKCANETLVDRAINKELQLLRKQASLTTST